MAQIPKGRLVKCPYKPIFRDCAIYFLITAYYIYISIIIQFILYIYIFIWFAWEFPKQVPNFLRISSFKHSKLMWFQKDRVFGQSGRDFSKLYFLQRGAAESKRHGLMWQDAAIWGMTGPNSMELTCICKYAYIYICFLINRVNLVKTKKV